MAPRYGCGDKVFAKVRGYPPWPARVDSIADSTPSNMKYHVFFYGTLERGVCRNQDLFPYQENKEKLSKPIKRKDFQRAINQIEGIEPVPQLVPIIGGKLGNGIFKELAHNTNTSNKNVEGNVIEKKKRSRSRKTAPPVTNENDTFFNIKGDSTEESKAKKCCPETKLPEPSKTCPPNKIGKTPEEKTKLLKPSSASFECSKPNYFPLSIPETSRSGRKIKRKVFADEIESPPSKKKKEEVSPQQKQASVPSGKKKDLPTTRCLDTPCKEAKRTGNNGVTGVDNSSYANKPSALEWLTTENCMTRLDTLIRSHLGMSRANPKQCIETLDSMCNLKLKPLMLKKHPEVVETIKRLRKYVGNAGAWNFSIEQQREFEEQAQEIRAKAECIFDKFKKMFSAPDNLSFLEIFADSVFAFQKKTEDWPLAKIYSLTSEPKVRKPHDKTSSEHKSTTQCKKIPENFYNHNSSERFNHSVPSVNKSNQGMSNATPIQSNLQCAKISPKYNGNHPSPKKKPVAKTKRQTKKTTEKKEKSILESTKQKSNQGNKRGRKPKVIK